MFAIGTKPLLLTTTAGLPDDRFKKWVASDAKLLSKDAFIRLQNPMTLTEALWSQRDEARYKSIPVQTDVAVFTDKLTPSKVLSQQPKVESFRGSVNQYSGYDIEDKVATFSVVRGDISTDEVVFADGFGFAIFANARPLIRGQGYEFCSRITLHDPVTGLTVDSHLPITVEDLALFEKDFGALIAYIADNYDVNPKNFVAGVIYGRGEIFDVPGEKVIDCLESKFGLRVLTRIRAEHGDQAFLLDPKTGSLSIDSKLLSAHYKNMYETLEKCFELISAGLKLLEEGENDEILLDTIRENLEDLTLALNNRLPQSDHRTLNFEDLQDYQQIPYLKSIFEDIIRFPNLIITSMSQKEIQDCVDSLGV